MCHLKDVLVSHGMVSSASISTQVCLVVSLRSGLPHLLLHIFHFPARSFTSWLQSFWSSSLELPAFGSSLSLFLLNTLVLKKFFLSCLCVCFVIFDWIKSIKYRRIVDTEVKHTYIQNGMCPPLLGHCCGVSSQSSCSHIVFRLCCCFGYIYYTTDLKFLHWWPVALFYSLWDVAAWCFFCVSVASLNFQQPVHNSISWGLSPWAALPQS